MTLLTLIVLGRYAYLDKYTISTMFKKVLFIVVIPGVLISTFTLYKLDVGVYLRVLINLIGFTILLMILTRELRFFRYLFSSTISYVLIIISESITGFILIYIFNINLYMENMNPIMNFWMSLPNRIIQYGFLYSIYLNINSVKSIKLFDMWFSNRIFRRLIYICLTFNMLIALFVYNKFAVEKCIETLSFETQLFIITVILIMFIYIMVIPWVSLYSVYPSEQFRNKFREE